MTISQKVYAFKTKHEAGFTNSELKELLKDCPDINMDKYNDALTGITVSERDGEMIIYHCDVVTVLRCGTENRGMRQHEFDQLTTL